MKRLALFLSLFALSLNAQNNEGFALEMFGGPVGTITSFESNYAYKAVAEWAELGFEAGAGFSMRQSAGDDQWGLMLTFSRMAFGYANSTFTNGHGEVLEARPVSTRRIYLNFTPLYAFQLWEGRGASFDLETSLGFKLPINAYSLAINTAGLNVDINDFDSGSFGQLTVYRAQIAPTIVWPATRLSVFGAYQMSSGEDWEILSGWSAGLQISYFIEE